MLKMTHLSKVYRAHVKVGPFVTLNCGALPSELIEAELFGADAGAYTGATKAREGKFEAADGGTRVHRANRRAQSRGESMRR